MLLEPAAQLRIKRLQSLHFGQAHAVGRVGNHDAALAVGARGLCILHLPADQIVHLGRFGIAHGGAYDVAVVIAAGYRCGGLEHDFGFGFAADFIPQRFIEAFELFKAEAAHQAGCALCGNPSRFDGNGAAAAEWVLKRLAAVVAGQKQQAGGEVFAQRRFARVLTVAAFK